MKSKFFLLVFLVGFYLSSSYSFKLNSQGCNLPRIISGELNPGTHVIECFGTGDFICKLSDGGCSQ